MTIYKAMTVLNPDMRAMTVFIIPLWFKSSIQKTVVLMQNVVLLLMY